MTDQMLNALLREYDHLSQHLNDNELGAFKAVPVVITVTSGAAAYLYKSETLDLSATWIFVSYIVFLLLTWFGFCHSIVNGRGLKLVELECKINELLSARGAAGMTFFTDYIAEGRNLIPGLLYYLVLSGVFYLAVLALCVHNILNLSEPVDLRTVLLGALPILLSLCVLVNMVHVERKTTARKATILEKHSSEPFC